ncbi:MAG: immunogenic protein [Rhodospirillaceae bacterium]|nr:immunogenic protein [Rhodospirillaceae bacterium]
MYTVVFQGMKSAVNLLFLFGLSWAVEAWAAPEKSIHFPIATGSVTGTYYPIGTLIARIISHPPGSMDCEDGDNCGVPNLIATAQSSQGSVSNARAIQDGRALSDFSQADVANDMTKSEGAFTGMPPLDKVLALANLYPESMQLVARVGSGIHGITDLVGKRVSMDRLGSGTRLVAGIVLAAHDIDEGSLNLVHSTPDQAISRMRRGEFDAFFIVAGTPTSAVESLTRDGIATVLPLLEERIRSILSAHPFFSRSTIPKGVYKGVGSITTIAVGAQWLVSADAPVDLINAVCRALWSEKRGRHWIKTIRRVGISHSKPR